MVSFLQTSSLHQQGRHSLRPFMELQAGEGAGHRPLQEEEEREDRGWSSYNSTFYIFRFNIDFRQRAAAYISRD